MSKINILVIPSDAYGVGKFRGFGPYTHLQENYGEDFHIDIKFDVENNDSELEKYDIIVAHSFIHKKNSNIDSEIRRINWLKNKGKIVIIDIDDYWTPSKDHPMYLQIINQKMNIRKIQLLKEASYITTTTPYFRDTIIKELNVKNVVVFPNAIDENENQYIPYPIKSDKIRFGWLGGSSHLEDIKLMSNGISTIHDYFLDRTQLILCGFDIRGFINEINKETKEVKQRKIKPEETVWSSYEKIFTKNYSILDSEYKKYLLKYIELPYPDYDKPYIRRWTKDINKYATNYNFIDVSLAPLVDIPFNNNKSQLKVIEAGFHKKALIASKCVPYTLDLINAFEDNGFKDNGNALLIDPYKNHKQWGTYIKVLINNPNFIKDLGDRLHETVKDKYSLRVVNKERAEFLKLIINNLK